MSPEVPKLPEVPTTPEAGVPVAPVSEEAQTAERLIGPPPGMTEEDMVRNADRIRAEREAEANAGSMVNRLSPSTVNTPPVPPAPLPSFRTAEETAAVNRVGTEANEPASPAPTESTTPESQA